MSTSLATSTWGIAALSRHRFGKGHPDRDDPERTPWHAVQGAAWEALKGGQRQS